jgi:hypothetical protein
MDRQASLMRDDVDQVASTLAGTNQILEQMQTSKQDAIIVDTRDPNDDDLASVPTLWFNNVTGDLFIAISNEGGEETPMVWKKFVYVGINTL